MAAYHSVPAVGPRPSGILRVRLIQPFWTSESTSLRIPSVTVLAPMPKAGARTANTRKPRAFNSTASDDSGLGSLQNRQILSMRLQLATDPATMLVLAR
jgi:hypothetical protein